MDFLPLIFQLAGLAIGGPVGALIGAFIGYALFGSMSGKSEGPRLQDLNVQSSAFGAPIPITWGSVRIAGNIIWSPGIREVKRVTKQGSGLLGGGATMTTYKYFFSGAIGLCEGEITTVRRIWANNRLIYGTKPSDPPTDEDFAATIPVGFELKIYTGSETQDPDPYIRENLTAYGEPGDAPAYRGTAYVVIKDFDLETYGNQVPHFEFEVIRGSSQPHDYQRLVVPDRGSGGYGGWDPEEGICWQAVGSSYVDGPTALGHDAYTMQTIYETWLPPDFTAPIMSRTADGKWLLTQLAAIGTNPSTPHWAISESNSPAHGFATQDSWIYNSNHWQPGPCWATSIGYMNFNGNGASGGAARCSAMLKETDIMPYLGAPRPWPNIWDICAEVPGWAFSTYGDQGGAPATRLTDEIGDYVQRSTVAWSWAWGWADTDRGWYRIQQHGASAAQIATGSVPSHSIGGSDYGMSGVGTFELSPFDEPSMAHDRSRDRMWMCYYDDWSLDRPDGFRLFYFNLQTTGMAREEVDLPELAEFDTIGGSDIALAYNPDLDILLMLGKKAGESKMRAVGWRPSLANLERLALGQTVDMLIDQEWEVGVWDWPSSKGFDTFSRENWVVCWENNDNALLKLWFGLPFSDTKVPLWQIVRDICLRCGLESTDIDVTELTDLVQGYALARPMTGRAAIEPLMPGYFFDAVETGEQT